MLVAGFNFHPFLISVGYPGLGRRSAPRTERHHDPLRTGGGNVHLHLAEMGFIWRLQWAPFWRCYKPANNMGGSSQFHQNCSFLSTILNWSFIKINFCYRKRPQNSMFEWQERYKKPDYVPIFKGAASRRVMLEILLGWEEFRLCFSAVGNWGKAANIKVIHVSIMYV